MLAPWAILSCCFYYQNGQNGVCNLLSLCKEMKRFDRSPDLVVVVLSTLCSLSLLSLSPGVESSGVPPVLCGSLTMDQLEMLGVNPGVMWKWELPTLGTPGPHSHILQVPNFYSKASVRITLHWPTFTTRTLIRKLNFLSKLLSGSNQSEGVFVACCRGCL